MAFEGRITYVYQKSIVYKIRIFYIFFGRMAEISLFVREKDLSNKMPSHEYRIDKSMNYVKIEVGFIKFSFS